MKFRTVSGRFEVSLTHVPGRGSGTREFSTGSQAELEEDCSLNLPAREQTKHKHIYCSIMVASLVHRLVRC